MNIKQNLKYQETHRAIMAAVLNQLQTRDIKQVTVSGVCRDVHINRSTFYEHFLDVYDVLEKSAQVVTAEMAASFAPDREPEKDDFLRLFEYIRRNREFFLLFFRQGLPMDVQERYFHRDPPHAAPSALAERGFTELQFEYGGVMFSAAFDALVRHWLERGCAETPEELCDIMLKMLRLAE